MAKGKLRLILFLIVGVLQIARAQIQCVIDIDSANKLWSDVTAATVPAQKPAYYCSSYLFHETSLSCSPNHCLPWNVRQEPCAVYRNVLGDSWPCVLPCNEGCTRGNSCNEQGACPCAEHVPRYSQAKILCVPLQRLQSCTEKESYENGLCNPRLCGDPCPNAYCYKGRCLRTCMDGSSLDTKTSKCVANECLDRCLDGTCDGYGVCTCYRGFKKDPHNKYRCIRIDCPDNEQTEYCQWECEQNGCTKTNGFCDKGECKCYQNFKKDPKNKHNCVRISCPDGEHIPHCQSKCLEFGCTQANGHCVEGVCLCKFGFKEDRYNKYKCVRIDCPDNKQTEYCQWECEKSGCKQANGHCEQGACFCNDGFKEDRHNKYNCDRIKCPDNERPEYCQWECERNGCTGGNCVQGECRCKDGFKKPLNTIYQCDKIKCPSVLPADRKYCASQCANNCHNGKCSEVDFCRCTKGFKKVSGTDYECAKISCPSLTVDEPYCKMQCDSQCQNGTCNAKGECNCNNSFKKLPDRHYECVKINCPSTAAEDDVHKTYCKNTCESLCANGVCDELGSCTCFEGFKKLFEESYNCTPITCPTSTIEDTSYCTLLCNSTCINGMCDERGACDCNQGFVSSDFTTNITCHLVCNEDGSCDGIPWIGIVGGGCAMIVVGIIVAVVIVVRTRSRIEGVPKKEQEVVQELPLEPVADEPEYENIDRDCEIMENDLYQSFDCQSGRSGEKI